MCRNSKEQGSQRKTKIQEIAEFVNNRAFTGRKGIRAWRVDPMLLYC
jgi:hypothetical protein